MNQNKKVSELDLNTNPGLTDLAYVVQLGPGPSWADKKVTLKTLQDFSRLSKTMVKGGSYTVQAIECDKRWFSNGYATEDSFFVLPTATEGMEVGFIVERPYTITIQADVGDEILPLSSMSGSQISSGTVGGSIYLRFISLCWQVVSMSGSWGVYSSSSSSMSSSSMSSSSCSASSTSSSLSSSSCSTSSSSSSSYDNTSTKFLYKVQRSSEDSPVFYVYDQDWNFVESIGSGSQLRGNQYGFWSCAEFFCDIISSSTIGKISFIDYSFNLLNEVFCQLRSVNIEDIEIDNITGDIYLMTNTFYTKYSSTGGVAVAYNDNGLDANGICSRRIGDVFYLYAVSDAGSTIAQIETTLLTIVNSVDIGIVDQRDILFYNGYWYISDVSGSIYQYSDGPDNLPLNLINTFIPQYSSTGGKIGVR